MVVSQESNDYFKHFINKGFEQAQPGEFTKRAFLNGKLDLTQSEAIHEVIQAQNVQSHIDALEKLGGSIFSYINTIKEKLLRLVATCNVVLDYPDDEIQESVDISLEDIMQALTMIDNVLQGYDLASIKKSKFSYSISRENKCRKKFIV